MTVCETTSHSRSSHWTGDVYSYTIVTTNANKELEFMHNRMPVILSSDADIAKWLDPTQTFDKDVAALLTPYPEGNLRWYPVSPIVGNVHNDVPECIAPIPQQSVAINLGKAAVPPTASSAAEEPPRDSLLHYFGKAAVKKVEKARSTSSSTSKLPPLNPDEVEDATVSEKEGQTEVVPNDKKRRAKSSSASPAKRRTRSRSKLAK